MIVLTMSSYFHLLITACQPTNVSSKSFPIFVKLHAQSNNRQFAFDNPFLTNTLSWINWYIDGSEEASTCLVMAPQKKRKCISL